MSSDLAVFALCLLGSAFFSASETALTSLPLARLEALRQKGGRLSRAAFSRWAKAPGEFLITILVGNNLVNVVASALASRIALSMSHSGSLAAAVGITTLAILIFGEITPKTLAQRYSVAFCRRSAPILYLLDIVLRPLNVILGLMSKLLSRKGLERVPVTEKDLLYLLRLAHRHAQLPLESRHMIESVLRFQQAVAREVMVPRPQVTTLDTQWTTQRVFQTIRSARHSRFPVVDGSPDAILGILHVKRLIDLSNKELWAAAAEPTLFIPEGTPLPDLLHQFRTSGKHLAIVLDEFGGTAGLLTLEDIIELLVGEIRDEFENRPDPDILPADEGFSIAAHLSLRRLERLLGRGLHQAEEVDSIGGVIARELGEKLAPGKEIKWSGLRLRVLKTDGSRPTRVLVIPPEDEAGSNAMEETVSQENRETRP